MRSMIKIRGHHIQGILNYLSLMKAKSMKDPFCKLRDAGYGDQFIDNKRRICDLLYSDPNQEIEVVNIPDDLCKAGCKKRSSKCANLKVTDVFAADHLGFEVGQTYTAQYFLDKAISL